MNFGALNLYHLKYLIDIVRLKSFTNAAAENCISRPAISQAMIRLESNLGYSLFKHQKRKLALTERGLSLVQSIEPILNDLHQAILKSGTSSNILRVGTSYSIFDSLLKTAFSTFLSDEHKNNLELSFGTSSQITNLLAADVIDFGIYVGSNNKSIFSVRELHSGKFILVRPLGKFDAKTLIVTEDRPESILVTKRYKYEFDRHIKVASWSACIDLLREKLGVALIPDFMLNKKEMTILQMQEVIPYSIYLAWKAPSDPAIIMKILNKK